MSDARREVIKSLAANVTIACAKAVASVISGSGAMLAETLHSFADCGNQILLLVGTRSSRKPADAKHPLGYGRAAVFLLVHRRAAAVRRRRRVLDPRGRREAAAPRADRRHLGRDGDPRVLDAARRLVAAQQPARDRQAPRHDEPVALPARHQGFGSDPRARRERRGRDRPRARRRGVAAVVQTGDGRWDALGSFAIGAVLVGVATFLAREVKSLLVGEAADPALRAKIEELAAADPNIERVLAVLAVQQGPGEIMLAMKLAMRAGLETSQLVDAINAFERVLKKAVPEIRWSFIEPDNAD